ncbi:MAG: VRR-NUC domain-containing protein [Pseudomonadota bacterium]
MTIRQPRGADARPDAKRAGTITIPTRLIFHRLPHDDAAFAASNRLRPSQHRWSTSVITEDVVHRSILSHLGQTLTGATFGPWHTPNGGQRPGIVGPKMRGLGVMPGIPDLLLLHDGGTFGLEIKRPGKNATPQQAALHEQMRAAGALIEVVRSIEEAQAALTKWGIATRFTGRFGGGL